MPRMPRGKIYVDGEWDASSPNPPQNEQNAVETLVATGHAVEVETPAEWREVEDDNVDISPPPVPPQLLQSGTAVNPGIAGENARRWQNLVEQNYDKEVNSNPLLTFSEGVESIWPTWDRPQIQGERNKVIFYAGNILGKISAGFLTGAATGSALGSSRIGISAAKKVASFSENHPALTTALKGVARGTLIGGEAAKGIMMKENGASWTDVVGTIMGDFGGFYGFEKGFTKTFASKVAKELTIEKTHKTVARHRVFAGKTENFLMGKEYSVNGERPIIMDRGPRVKVLPDKERSVVGAVEYTYKGRPLGERPVLMKKFMTAGERSAFGEKFPFAGFKSEEIYSGGMVRPMQILKEKTVPKLGYDAGFGALRKTLKELSASANLEAMTATNLMISVPPAMSQLRTFSLLKNAEQEKQIKFEPMIRQDQAFGQETKTFQGTATIVIPRSVILQKQKTILEPEETPDVKTENVQSVLPRQDHKPPIEPPSLFPPQQKQKEIQKPVSKPRRTSLWTSTIAVRRGKNPVLFKPFSFFPTKRSASSAGGGSIENMWSVDNQWGDIGLGINSLKQQFREIENMFGGNNKKSGRKGAKKWDMAGLF